MPASGDEDSWFCPSAGLTMDASVQEKGLVFMRVSLDVSSFILHLKILSECDGLAYLRFW